MQLALHPKINERTAGSANFPLGKLNSVWGIANFPWGKLNSAWGIADPDQGRFDLQRAR